MLVRSTIDNIKMNTKLTYKYVDKSNFEESRQIVFGGEVTNLLTNLFTRHLRIGKFFIPHQVYLPDLQTDLICFPSDNDHVWHEYVSMGSTEDSITDNRDAGTFIAQFCATPWNEDRAMAHLGLEEVVLV